MKYFEVEYISNGNRKTVNLVAENKFNAIKNFRVKSMGVFIDAREISEPFSVKFSFLKKNLIDKLTIKKIPLEPYIASLRQVSTMLNAGLSITVCFQDVLKTTKNKRLKYIFTKVLEEVESGVSVSKAFKIFENEIGAISIALFDLGEKTGTLDEAIEKLADILQEVYDNRMKLKKATRYPIVVVVAMIIAFSVVIIKVVPQFQSMFQEYNATLPFPTVLLLWIEQAIRQYGLFVLLGALLVSTILTYMYKKSFKIRLFFDRYILKVYIVGNVMYLSMIGRFVYVFNRLSSSGLPIMDSIGTAIDIVENSYLKERLRKIIKAIEEGRSLTDGFKETQEFQSMVIQMISAGENSGSLSKMLEKISNMYKKKYAYLIDNVSIMIEPLLIAAIAGFVLLLALGIFLPMWSIADAVGGT